MLVLVEVSLGAGEWEDRSAAGKDSAMASYRAPGAGPGGAGNEGVLRHPQRLTGVLCSQCLLREHGLIFSIHLSETQD